jgi:chromosome segregation ATPase
MSESPINSQNIRNLTELRDQLKVQAHLLQADLKDRWTELEAKWDELQEHLGRAAVAAKDSQHDVAKATDSLADALKKGYENVKAALKS